MLLVGDPRGALAFKKNAGGVGRCLNIQVLPLQCRAQIGIGRGGSNAVLGCDLVIGRAHHV